MAILTIIGGILILLGGASLIGVGTLISVVSHRFSKPILWCCVVGSVLLVIGIGYLVMSW
jgi:hypothetical protein